MIRMKALLSPSTASDIVDPAMRARKPTTMLGALGLAALVLGQSAQATQTTAPFQQYKNTSCTDSDCFLYFNDYVVEVGTRLDIDNVSCYLKSRGELNYLQLGAFGAGVATLVPTSVSVTPTGESTYAANSTVSMTARPGQVFFVTAETTEKIITLACQVSGQLVRF